MTEGGEIVREKYSNMAKRGGRSGISEERMEEKGGDSRAFPFSVFCLSLAMIPLELELNIKG